MYYVMSDIHGEYEKYLAMLKKIAFSEEDTLFILGDVLDRGPSPMAVLQDMMSYPNIYPLLGNHELMAMDILYQLNTEIRQDNYASVLNQDTMQKLIDWQLNGGQTTLLSFQSLDLQQRADILDYLTEFSLYEVIDVQDKSYILTHPGLGNFHIHKKIKDYSIAELVWNRPNDNQVTLPDKNTFIICGHTPTLSFHGKPEIYHVNQHIYIDCGACFSNGKLACLCIDTMEEFYV